jgi:DNA mismatch repair protein MutL
MSQAETSVPKVGGKIRLLPPALINRIAAGEVVERPASVVKEMVENAIDAGATRIEIAAGAGGRTIRIADNGCGMAPEDAAMAFYNHATSKIRAAEDLDRIETLGFRGEALASIGSISRLTCLTRTADAPRGTKVTLDEQGEPALSEAGCAPGTVMEIQDLFYNTPARLKFLKRPQTELGHIEETVQFLALSHPEVRFSLALNEKEVLKTSGSGEVKRTLEEIFDLKKENVRLLPVVMQDALAGLTLAGFTSEPGVMKSSKRWLVTFVNGRHVRCAILQKAIEAAYESLLPHGRYPLSVLFLRVPPSDVDVNVHPTKREVRYTNSGSVFGFVKAGLRHSMSAHGLSFEPSTPFPASPLHMPETVRGASLPHGQHAQTLPAVPNPAGTRLNANGFADRWQSATPQVDWLPLAENANTTPIGANPVVSPKSGLMPETVSPDSVQAALSFYSPEGTGQNALGQAMAATGAIPESAEPKADASAEGWQDKRFKVIGQLFNTYILLETVQGLMVVDQHIASERTFFEILTLNLTGNTPDVQHRVVPQILTIGPVQRDLLQRHQADFARLGFLYDLPEDESVVALIGYPLVYDGRDGVFRAGGLFENLLSQLEETGEMKLDLDHLIATLSCHSAVRAGDSLTLPEMNTVIERWLACKLPWTCPHGRPIAHTFSKSELNQFFLRPGLPVNSL